MRRVPGRVRRAIRHQRCAAQRSGADLPRQRGGLVPGCRSWTVTLPPRLACLLPLLGPGPGQPTATYAIGAGHRGRPKGGSGAGGSRWALGTAGMRNSIVVRWVAGAAAAIVAVFGVAFAVTLTGNQTPTGSGHHPQAGTTPLRVTLSTPAPPETSKSAKTRAGRSPSISPSQARSSAASLVEEREYTARRLIAVT